MKSIGRVKLASDNVSVLAAVYVSTKIGMKLEKMDPWSRNPKSLLDLLTLEEAKAGGGEKIMSNLGRSKI